MGYYARYTGSIEISPPLPWNLIKDHPALPADPTYRGSATGGDRDVRLVVETELIDTEDGTLTKKRAVAVEPATDDAFKGYEMQAHLQEVVDAAPGRTFTGHIDATGDDGQQWRFKVVDGTVRRFEPVLVWPEGAE
jgi:uncharacterized protein DUF6205